MVDYLFGRGVSRSLPSEGMKLVYSRKSGRVKLVYHNDRLFATVRPNGSMALTMHAAKMLSAKSPFLKNCVTVDDDAVPFVQGGRSVFCKFVTKVGSRVRPKGDVAVLDKTGRVVGVGTSVLAGQFIQQFKTGVAVKVREGLPR